MSISKQNILVLSDLRNDETAVYVFITVSFIWLHPKADTKSYSNTAFSAFSSCKQFDYADIMLYNRLIEKIIDELMKNLLVAALHATLQ